MHPDCLLLQKHGVSSPRLSSSSKMEQKDDDDLLRIEDDTEDEEEEKNSSTQNAEDEYEDVEANSSRAEDCEEELSICSEDSDLSVGRENGSGVASLLETSPALSHNLRAQRLLGLNNVSGLMSVNMNLNRTSAFSSVMSHTALAAAEASDARSSASTDETTVPDEETATNALRMPLPQLALVSQVANTSPFQEEFLRKSHIYAEELMKHQMHLMAAARVSAFNLQQSTAVHSLSTDVKSLPQSKLPNLPNFAGIHSHLTAISKMSQLSAVASAAAAAAVASNRLQLSQPKAISSLQQLQAQMQAHLPSLMTGNEHQQHEDEPSLKFSIDNILKADFGRRITDPLLKRAGSSGNGTSRASKHAKLHRNKSSASSASTSNMELSNLMNSSVNNASSLSFSNSLANICTNSNDSNSTVISSNADLLKSPSSQMPAGAGSASSASPVPHTTDGAESESKSTGTGASGNGPIVWPAWVYCTRYSDRPSSGRSPRTRKPKKPASEKGTSPPTPEDKRPRTAFSGSQLARLKHEFTENRYLTEKRRQQLSSELGLNEAQIKIWFQNKRAKLKKSSGSKNPLALQLMAQGLYNHSTVPLTREEEELQELQERENANAQAVSS